MSLTLKPEDERFLAEQVRAGRYNSAADALADAIDRLRWERDVAPTAADLVAVRLGLDQLDRGQGVPWEQARSELNAKHGIGE